MMGYRPTDTLIEFNAKLKNSSDRIPVDKEKYQHLVRKLIYLSHTRLDIFNVVNYVKYCTFVWGNLVTWRSKKQGVMARSSIEAEYRAMSLGIYEKI
ncbi:putative mitochondrial protein [Cucumis melo var. makuwa]|uniref:Putative mitochondrial protein n=1 Tax=Cucumis melo var. makuwa TaxID=1194695 RepID=A0A5D3DTR5_CUCMM|nr:putative mitochondrial protein [Cucumis melo var. makuwa]